MLSSDLGGIPSSEEEPYINPQGKQESAMYAMTKQESRVRGWGAVARKAGEADSDWGFSKASLRNQHLT